MTETMLVTKTNNTLIQAEYQMEAEYISNNTPAQIIENINVATELDDLPKNPNLKTF